MKKIRSLLQIPKTQQVPYFIYGASSNLYKPGSITMKILPNDIEVRINKTLIGIKEYEQILKNSPKNNSRIIGIKDQVNKYIYIFLNQELDLTKNDTRDFIQEITSKKITLGTGLDHQYHLLNSRQINQNKNQYTLIFLTELTNENKKKLRDRALEGWNTEIIPEIRLMSFRAQLLTWIRRNRYKHTSKETWYKQGKKEVIKRIHRTIDIFKNDHVTDYMIIGNFELKKAWLIKPLRGKLEEKKKEKIKKEILKGTRYKDIKEKYNISLGMISKIKNHT